MKQGRLKNFTRFAVLSLGLGAVTAGCSLAVTRPIQEMANAEVAIRAAKDLNADSLVPEIFRAANESFYKAKRDFRLKDFDNARANALKAMRLAEQAEFEAYRMGGATPEASNRASSPEGAFPDPEDALREGTTPPREPVLEEAEDEEPAPSKEEPGTDYNEHLRQQEAEESDRKAKEKETKKPSGQTGPAAPRSKPNRNVTPPNVGTQDEALRPTEGLAPGLSGHAPPEQDLRPDPNSPPPLIYYEGAKPLSPMIEEMDAQQIDTMRDTEIETLGHDAPIAQDGLDELKADEAGTTQDAQAIPEMGEYAGETKPSQKEEQR